MSVWAVIPVKPFEEGKTRLASVLDAAERHALNRFFLAHTLEAALSILPADNIVVVSRSPEVQSMALALGVLALPDTMDTLNAAFATGRRHARDADAVLSLSSDLPFLTPDDLLAMLRVPSSPTVTIAADRHGTGTNALLLRPPEVISYAYGPMSFDAHCRAAAEMHAVLVVVSRPGLQFDVDTPEDLRVWRARQPHSDGTLNSPSIGLIR
jgi:2-phospho-L-lactate guanylyltransferase